MGSNAWCCRDCRLAIRAAWASAYLSRQPFHFSFTSWRDVRCALVYTATLCSYLAPVGAASACGADTAVSPVRANTLRAIDAARRRPGLRQAGVMPFIGGYLLVFPGQKTSATGSQPTG